MTQYLYKNDAGVVFIGRVSAKNGHDLHEVVKLHVTHSTAPKPPRVVYVPYIDLEELHAA